MTFEEAEARFRELQARVQRGEAISRAEYEDQVSQLAVQDDRGVLWEINPRTGKWMYFDGAEWVGGTPPGRDHSTVMPAPRGPVPQSPTTSQPSAPFAPPNASASVVPPPPPVAPPPPQSTGPVPLPARPVPGGMRPASQMPDPIPAFSSRERAASQAASGPGGQPNAPVPPRVLRQGPLGGPNREWVPLAIGAAILLLCAVLLFLGSRALPSIVGTSVTPTRAQAAVPIATNTLMPTPVKLPTTVAATATVSPVIAKVMENTVNVREGPSTTAKKLTTVKKNTQISLVAKNDKGDWYQINVAGLSSPGWIFADTLTVVSGNPQLLPVAGASPAPAPTKAGAQGPATPTVIGARP